MSRAEGVEWWVGTPPAEAVIDCGPNRHRLVWQHGRLAAVDHQDPEAERILDELGGSEPPCLSRLRQWAAHAADPRVLTLAGRHPGDTLGLDAEDVAAVGLLLDQDEARQALGAGRPSGASTGPPHASTSAPARVEANRRHVDLLDLLTLDPALVRRLQAEVADNLSGRDPLPPSVRAVLEAATVGRLVPVAERWSGTGRPGGHAGDRRVTVLLGARPSVRRSPVDLTVTVRPDWLATVWGRYLGVVEGFLVLEVHRVVDERAEVTAVGAPAGDPARLVLSGPAPWRVVHRFDPES